MGRLCGAWSDLPVQPDLLEDREHVEQLIAGGDRALRHPVEGAEDNAEAGAWELRERGLEPGDAVVAISASGRTPYVLGALHSAWEIGARTIGITWFTWPTRAETIKPPSSSSFSITWLATSFRRLK